MIDIEEIAARTLSELEEAGEENIPTILNTIFAPTGEAWEKDGLIEAVNVLITQGLARMAFERDESGRLVDASREESIDILDGISKTLSFDVERSLWTDQDILSEDYPDLVVTDAGWEKSRKILEERGYQWWLQKGGEEGAH